MNKQSPHQFCRRTRREMLWQSGAGFMGTALAAMLGDQFFAQQSRAADGQSKFTHPLAPKDPHHAPKAKNVIFLYMYGGPSHMDTFDYKPEMYGRDNQTVEVKTFGRGGHKNKGRLVEPRWKFKQYGESGKWVSDLFPHTSGNARRRHCFPEFNDSRVAHPWIGHADDELRANSAQRPGPCDGFAGSTTAWAHSTKTYPVLS